MATRDAVDNLIKNTLVMMGFSSAVNILGQTLTKNMQKELDYMIEDAENEAIRKIGIYEEKI